MAPKIRDFLVQNEWLLVVCLVLIFVLIRLPGVDLPLHQDEYKWPIIVNPANTGDMLIPHPPLSEFIYRNAGQIVGYNVNFRFIPLFFGAVNLILLYFLMKILFGRKEALIASFIWIFSYFSVLASLMVDTDGQILPFFFLLSLIGYYKLLESEGNKRYLWGGLLLASSICGFFVKVSFLLAICAILVDFLWSKKHLLSKNQALKYFTFIMVGVFGLGLLLFLAKFIFPFFDLSASFEYWKHFLIGDRGWFQTTIQCIKALFYTSPFLVLIPFLGSKNSFSKVGAFVFFLLFSFIFYILLFDFSIGALDRYLQLLILPLTVISTAVISKILDGDDRKYKGFLCLGMIVGLILILLQSVPHYVPSLHPKSDWIGRVLSLKWNFVYPFSGGSGPLGFYISFLFIALSWLVTFIFVAFGKIKTDYKKLVLVFLIPIGLTYNLVFTLEYLTGYFNGYAPGLLKEAVIYIKDNPDIKMVTVYNDNGGNEIQQIGKYRKRLYVDPKFDINNKIETLNKYKEHYFVLDVPRIDPTSVYQKYFNSCKNIYSKVDKKMSAVVYDCRDIPDIKI
ncbi:MAG: hypothetical protein CEO12_203 [Parcubacteria group bacterium Gr01-1014_46]|nr:MAG: hypothetical protein CEO12_203 [Parcubacteria group bacterium Gr01-1014_46]